MKDFPLTLCALALAVSTSIGASSCTSGTDGDFDPCEAYCDKVDDCGDDDDYDDCEEDCNELDSLEDCANDCDEGDDCEDYFECVWNCVGEDL